MNEYWVEYEWIETPYGRRANRIKICKTMDEAEAFARDYADAKVMETRMTKL